MKDRLWLMWGVHVCLFFWYFQIKYQIRYIDALRKIPISQLLWWLGCWHDFSLQVGNWQSWNRNSHLTWTEHCHPVCYYYHAYQIICSQIHMWQPAPLLETLHRHSDWREQTVVRKEIIPPYNSPWNISICADNVSFNWRKLNWQSSYWLARASVSKGPPSLGVRVAIISNVVVMYDLS